MQQQRVVEADDAKAAVEGRWLEVARREGAGEEGVDWTASLGPGTWYVAVDEYVGGSIGLVVTPWPEVDRAGRQIFSDDMRVVWFAAEQLQPVVDQLHAAVAQEQRPIRIGDVFAVTGAPEDIASWATARDVTKDARRAAKVATFATAAGTVPREQAEELGLMNEDEVVDLGPRPSGPTVQAAV